MLRWSQKTFLNNANRVVWFANELNYETSCEGSELVRVMYVLDYGILFISVRGYGGGWQLCFVHFVIQTIL